MDLKDLMENIKRMMEEDHGQLQQCAKTKGIEFKEARRAEKEEDMDIIRGELMEIQSALEKLKGIRMDSSMRQGADSAAGMYVMSKSLSQMDSQSPGER